METRIVYLLSFRARARDRAHFAIWVPYANNSTGTSIHVVGGPMVGFKLEFKRAYDPAITGERYESFQIGQIDAKHVHDFTGESVLDSDPRSNLEIVASQIPPPRISQSLLGPVNGTTNRRCQEWTADFVARLVELQYLDSSTRDIVQSKRDPPTHGIGLTPVPRPQPQQQAHPQQQQQQSSANVWEWDATANRYRRYDGAQWVWQE